MATNLFSEQKTAWITEARQVAHLLLKKQYSITIEDVMRVHPLPRFLHRNTIGNVLSSGEFKRIGYRPALKTSSHGRVISVWTEKLQSDTAVVFDEPLPKNYRRIARVSRFGRED